MASIFNELKRVVNENDDKSVVVNLTDPKAEVIKAYLDYCAKSGKEFNRWDLGDLLDKLD